MDREYKEIMYSAMFDELDRVQSNKLYTDEELQKLALNVTGLGQSIGRGFKSLVSNPKGVFKGIKRTYQRGAREGGGVIGGVKRVLSTDTGRALASGIGGVGAIGGLGYVAGRANRD